MYVCTLNLLENAACIGSSELFSELLHSKIKGVGHLRIYAIQAINLFTSLPFRLLLFCIQRNYKFIKCFFPFIFLAIKTHIGRFRYRSSLTYKN